MHMQPSSPRSDDAALPRWNNRATADVEEGDSPFGDPGWWLSGGLGLAAWTGLALLMTGTW